jgi:hypothetical protein
MKAPWSDPGLQELLAQDDVVFAAIFAVESATVIAEALRRSR